MYVCMEKGHLSNQDTDDVWEVYRDNLDTPLINWVAQN